MVGLFELRCAECDVECCWVREEDRHTTTVFCQACVELGEVEA